MAFDINRYIEAFKECYLDYIAGFLLSIILILILAKVAERKKFVIYFVVLMFLVFVSKFFMLELTCQVLFLILLALLGSFYIAYSDEILSLFRKKKKNTALKQVREELDEEEFYEIINKAVLDFSANKVGAIITFETSENLQQFIDKGIKLGAKVSVELLETIFYVGTPMHDGATIIRGANIEATAVFYKSTNRLLNGSYGARHRAAIGFSEIHKGVTIVVSEETGRIHIAIDGNLIPCDRDHFKGMFKSYLTK